LLDDVGLTKRDSVRQNRPLKAYKIRLSASERGVLVQAEILSATTAFLVRDPSQEHGFSRADHRADFEEGRPGRRPKVINLPAVTAVPIQKLGDGSGAAQKVFGEFNFGFDHGDPQIANSRIKPNGNPREGFVIGIRMCARRQFTWPWCA
jgi:hypothetical protein